MTKSKFQLVGSLLRPADLRKYKDEIEHRDDIQYPFYDALPGYQETETAVSYTHLDVYKRQLLALKW